MPAAQRSGGRGRVSRRARAASRRAAPEGVSVARALAPSVAVGLARAQPARAARHVAVDPFPPARARARAETIADALAVLAAAADVLARQPFARGALAAAGALARARREVARVARRCAVGVAAPPLAARPVPPVVAHAAPAAAERALAGREAEAIARRPAPLGLAHARAAPRIAAAVPRAADALGRRAWARAVLAARAAPAVGAHGRILHDEGEPRRRQAARAPPRALRTTLPFAVLLDATSIASSCSVAGAARAGPATKAAAAPGVTTSSHARRSSRSPGAAPAPMRRAVDCSRPCASGSRSHAAPTHPPSHAQRPPSQRPWAWRPRRARRVASSQRAPRQPNSHAQVALRQRPWSEQSHVVGLRRSHAAPAHRRREAHVRPTHAPRPEQAGRPELRGLRDGLRTVEADEAAARRRGRRRRRRGRSSRRRSRARGRRREERLEELRRWLKMRGRRRGGPRGAAEGIVRALRNFRAA